MKRNWSFGHSKNSDHNLIPILVYGAEVWQIPTREINKILSTEMDVLRSARKSRMERIKNERILTYSMEQGPSSEAS